MEDAKKTWAQHVPVTSSVDGAIERPIPTEGRHERQFKSAQSIAEQQQALAGGTQTDAPSPAADKTLSR